MKRRIVLAGESTPRMALPSLPAAPLTGRGDETTLYSMVEVCCLVSKRFLERSMDKANRGVSTHWRLSVRDVSYFVAGFLTLSIP